MIVTVVGSGTLVPSARRSTPNLVITTPDGQISVDGGSGSLRRQAELGIDYRNTHTLFFTHIHPDHTLDAIQFLFASRYDPAGPRRDAVRIVGPRGFRSYLDELRRGVLPWTRGGDGGIEVDELEDGESRSLAGLTATAVRLEHAVVNLGYRFRHGAGGTAAFTGDTAPCAALERLAAGVDLLVAECSSVESAPLDGHLTAADAGRTAARGGVGQLVLTHLYPLPDDRVRIAEAAFHYPGPIRLAEDGDRFEV